MVPLNQGAQVADASPARVPARSGAIWINEDLSQYYLTLNEAVTAAKDGDVIHVNGGVTADALTNANVNKKVTVDITENVTVAGDGKVRGVTLSGGAKIQTKKPAKLTMSGFSTALVVGNDSKITDGSYVLGGNAVGFALTGTGQIAGSSARDSVVSTDNKDKTADNCGANRGTKSTYVVLGGSYLVKYDPTFNHDVTTPTNGEENGNEWLSYFTLTDNSVNELKPINKNGKAYTYPVANASKDGKKHVFVPEAKVTFSLNNKNASFADGKSEDKKVSTIRGYKLDDVEGNVKPGTPADKTGIDFLGWFYRDENGTEKEFKWDEVVKTDLNVYAKWNAKTVAYHNAKDVKHPVSIKTEESTAKVLSNEDIIKENAQFKVPGKAFKYWTEDPAGKGKQYKPGDTLSFTGDVKNFDLYAQYDTDHYTVKFSANGGTFADDSVFKTNPNVFTIEKDADGGDVAVLNKKAEYGQKLHDLLNGLDHNKLKPDNKAKKIGYVLAHEERWSEKSDGSDYGVKFIDTSFFGIPFSGDNPEITSDATYYMKWKLDAGVHTTKADLILPSDLYGDDASKSKNVQIVKPGEKFSLTGAVDISGIKAQMTGIENAFGATEDKFAEILVSGAKSTFTAKVKVPNGISIPENPTVTAKGLGDCFDIEKVVKSGQDVVITFKLKSGIDNYKKLKDAVESAGIASGDRDTSSWITLKINDLTVDAGVQEKELAVVGSVVGDFSAIASRNNKIERFEFTWKGEQTAEGKDVKAKDDKIIQYTLLPSKPLELSLKGDILIKEKDGGFNTEHESTYPAEKGDVLDYVGRLDVSPIQNQIKALSDSHGGINKVKDLKLAKVDSEFTVKINLDDGLETANIDKDKISLTNNDLFEIDKTSTVISGNKITVKMVLKNKDYKKFAELYDAVASVPTELDLLIPGVKVSATANKTKLKVVGAVEGKFYGEATDAAGNTKPFNFKWNAVQSDEGRDIDLLGDPAKKDLIQLTVELTPPLSLELEGDILIGEETQHNAVYPVEKKDELSYTGRLDISPVKA